MDDSLTIVGGLVNGLNVDSVIPTGHIFAGSTLQLNLDHSWSVVVHFPITVAGVVDQIAGTDASGTYTVTPATVPEPGGVGFLAAAILGAVLYRRKMWFVTAKLA